VFEPGAPAYLSCQPLFAVPFTQAWTSAVTLKLAIAVPLVSPGADTEGAVWTKPLTAPKPLLVTPAQPPDVLLSLHAVPIRKTLMFPLNWQLVHPV
jgi:hypothetical protein